MKKLPFVLALFSLVWVFFSCGIDLNKDSGFGAYYTKIDSGEEFEQFSRTGDYPDIIVDLGTDYGQLVFWRGASFLPYWKTADASIYYLEEIIPRAGDGPFKWMPDRVNTYSHVKIIESNPREVLIHWRYLRSFVAGNPNPGVSPDGFVDEYFTVHHTGEIHRTIREGRKKTVDWEDPGKIVCQTIILDRNGLRSSDLQHDFNSLETEAIVGQPLIPSMAERPSLHLSFDEGIGELVHPDGAKKDIAVTGRKVLWRNGISGTCLQFDGYHTEVRLPSERTLAIDKEMSLQAFVALGAYPWSWCPIIQQCDDVDEQTKGLRMDGKFIILAEKENDTGFFLGIDGSGHPGFKLRVQGQWEELSADFFLARRQWYLITATFNGDAGEMKLFVNDQLVAVKKVGQGPVELSKKDLLIGRGKPRRPINPVRENTFPAQYAFDGLIDEVRVFNSVLSPEEIANQFEEASPIMNQEVDMDPRVLPDGEGRKQFGAYYTHLRFYDIWDNLWCFGEHPDVVVEFDDNPSKFIFWRGVSYIPMMVNERGQWYSNEFNETWGTSGGDGCQEPMSDKGNYFTYARILENTPARVVVHYRFPLADVNLVKANYVEETGWYDVADWYYYIYPDGMATKRMHLWTSGNRNHEWQESMAIFGPDQHPEDIIEKNQTVTMLNMNGDRVSYNWSLAPPPAVSEPKDQCIQIVNYSGQYDPVSIGERFEGSDVYGGELTPYSVFPTWNHWPVAQMPSDGRYASFADRTGHSSLTHVYLPIYREADGDRPFYEKLLMEGMVDTQKTDLVSLARSWNLAPEIEIHGSGNAFYDKSQRAYVIHNASQNCHFVLKATPDRPLYNCCLVLQNWNKEALDAIHINGEPGEFKQGLIRDADGRYKLLIWLNLQSTEEIEVNLSPRSP